MEPITLTPDDDGTRVTPLAGQTVVIRLPENPTTGFSWQLPEGAVVVQDDFEPATSSAAGAAGERVLTLATGQAAGTLHFELKRPWEEGAPEQQFTIHVAPPE